MRWFRRRARTGPERGASADDLRHLEDFARTRRGVEGFVEPRTTVTEPTLVLVAHDGEWTRRRVGGPEQARRFAGRLGIPVYDAQVVGYPKRMREWTQRRSDPR